MSESESKPGENVNSVSSLLERLQSPSATLVTATQFVNSPSLTHPRVDDIQSVSYGENTTSGVYYLN